MQNNTDVYIPKAITECFPVASGLLSKQQTGGEHNAKAMQTLTLTSQTSLITTDYSKNQQQENIEDN